MRRDFRLYLDDILFAVMNIKEYVSGFDYDSFFKDRKTQDAVIRNLEVIGEAAGHLPEFLRNKAHEIEWRKIVALRNMLIHEYFGVSIPVIWDIVQNKINPLEIVVKDLLADDEVWSEE